MKSVLFLDISCKNFDNRTPTARIFIGNKFIDEFEIPIDQSLNTEQKTFFNYLEFSGDKEMVASNFIKRIQNLKNLMVYELETPDNNFELKVEIKNDYNNYTNGFMTKFCPVRLNYIDLIPLKIFKNMQRFNNWPFNKPTFKYNDVQKIKKSYIESRPILFGNKVTDVNFYTQDQRTSDLAKMFIGKSGFLNLQFYKKHNLYFTKKFCGYSKVMPYRFLKFIFDKYIKDENQRNMH